MIWGLGVVAGFPVLQWARPNTQSWQLGTELLVKRFFLACRFLDAFRAGTVQAHSMSTIEKPFDAVQSHLNDFFIMRCGVRAMGARRGWIRLSMRLKISMRWVPPGPNPDKRDRTIFKKCV